jgi:hypothetical protein
VQKDEQANSDVCKDFEPDSTTVAEAVPGDIESDDAGDKQQPTGNKKRLLSA